MLTRRWQDMVSNRRNFVQLYGPKMGTGASREYDLKDKDAWVVWLILGFLVPFACWYFWIVMVIYHIHSVRVENDEIIVKYLLGGEEVYPFKDIKFVGVAIKPSSCTKPSSWCKCVNAKRGHADTEKHTVYVEMKEQTCSRGSIIFNLKDPSVFAQDISSQKSSSSMESTSPRLHEEWSDQLPPARITRSVWRAVGAGGGATRSTSECVR